MQKNAAAARSMSRFLERLFDEVRVVGTPEEAERILAAGEPPTHLICGHDWGPTSATGASLIPQWRTLCPSLIRVVLATGALELPAALPGVDAVFHKPARPAQLFSLLAA